MKNQFFGANLSRLVKSLQDVKKSLMSDKNELIYRKVIINLPDDQVAFLQKIADRESITFTQALRKCISCEQFLVECEDSGSQILIESEGAFRKLVRNHKK
jgi:hypothetical protein